MRFPSFLLLLLVGCSSSHVDTDAGAVPDTDAAIPDAAVPDAGVDAGPPPGFSSCAPTAGELVGEGCFCNGPATLYGDVLYRQSIGIEVWDVSDPAAPARVGTVMERASSEGGLAIVDGHLVSVRNLDAALTVYSLDDPLDPTEVASLPLEDAGPMAFAASEDLAVIAYEGAEPALVAVDLSTIGAPREAWRQPVGARVAAVVIDGDRVYAATREISPARALLEVRDRATGASLGRHVIAEGDGASWFFGLAVHRGRLVSTGENEVVIWDVAGAPTPFARLDLGMDRPTTLTVDGDLLLIGGSSLVVADLTDPSAPRALGRGPAASGDVRTLAAAGGWAFVSNGNGLLPVSLGCE